MIKWLICLIWGHDLNQGKKANIFRHDGQNETLVGRYLLCDRCKKYIEVLHV